MIRQPAVAGTFYSAFADTLHTEVAKSCMPDPTRQAAIAVICPHAGYMYSGAVAGAVFARITVPETVILIGPNHTGLGPTISVFAHGSWLIPGAEIHVNSDLADMLVSRVPGAETDTVAHQYEHCLEVQLPFLEYVRQTDHPTAPISTVRIVPIVLGTTHGQICRTLGLALADVMREYASRGHGTPLLLASTDMNHYESDAITRKKDRLAIDAIQQLDPDRLGDTVTGQRISMCGAGPTIAVLHAVRALGATAATLVRYATSGEVNRDLQRVVGYAGLVVT